MSKQRTVRLECGKPTQVIYVLGTELNIDIYKPSPLGSQTFEVRSSPGVKCSISDQHNVNIVAEHATRWTLNKGTLIVVTMDKISNGLNESKVTVTFYGDKLENLIDKMILQLTAVSISLDVDADRDGKIEENNPNKGSWSWGPNGHGAVLLVNCDKDELDTTGYDNSDDAVAIFEDLKDMSPMILRTKGPDSLPSGYKLQLYISASDKEKVRVFRHDLTKMTNVLDRKKLSVVMDYTTGRNEYNFFAEGLIFPDEGINSLVTFNLSLLEPLTVGEAPIFTEQAVFRLAPWIMTPNTLAPEEVFVCSVKNNEKFLKEFTAVVEKAKCKLTVCSEYMNRNDRWIQDEIEFGYTEAPHKYFPVVLDSPRDRGLSEFPYQKLLGPDFGHVTRTSDEVSSLDSFGNLEVSPPVTVNGKKYPMGRIIIGSAFPTTSDGRNMSKVVRDLLYAQKVQSPIELFSDWLLVGHVDEFMTFVPAPDRKGFRLLLVSPDACCKLFMKLQQEGHGDAQMFQGLKRKTVKINEILSNQKLLEDNAYVQQCIDWNRDVLKRELGLDEEDIIDIPVLFELNKSYQAAEAFFPDMVNMIVLGQHLGIPKPFGPLINGKCPLESAVRSALEPLGLDCNFIDDFAAYHVMKGEVHCGSNVRRKSFALKWWNMEMGKRRAMPWKCVIFILLAIVEGSSSCPSVCTCSRMQENLIVDCANAGLNYLPFDIPKAVNILRLRNNLIKLETNSFRNTPDLQVLHLQKNNLTLLPGDLFAWVPRLRGLYLYSNQLSHLPDSIFNNVSNLEYLLLNGNQLLNVSDQLFLPLKKLKTLILSNNHLQVISPRVFLGLEALKVLSLAFNHLSVLPEPLFHPLHNLRICALNNNRLDSLPEKAFYGLRNLTWITLANNNLRELPSKLFSHTPLLKLFLYSNQLKSLPTGFLHSLKDLTYLGLHENQLELVPDGAFQPLANLSAIRLDQNPWRCDSDNSYLRCWIKHHRNTVKSRSISKPDSVICHTPEHLAGSAMVNVSDREMGKC